MRGYRLVLTGLSNSIIWRILLIYGTSLIRFLKLHVGEMTGWLEPKPPTNSCSVPPVALAHYMRTGLLPSFGIY